MNEDRVRVTLPQNLGWLEYDLSQSELDYVWRCIENKKSRYNDCLAGHISGSYTLQDRSNWFFLNVLRPLCMKYAKVFGKSVEWRVGGKKCFSQEHPYYLNSWWVNYQKQGEFNPTHDHTGVYSFVLWLKIPFEHEEQNKNPISARANCHHIGDFEFMTIDSLGCWQQYTYEMSSKREGTMLFFPASLPHQVYPFYNCDEERISVSGNVMLNTAKIL